MSSWSSTLSYNGHTSIDDEDETYMSTTSGATNGYTVKMNYND